MQKETVELTIDKLVTGGAGLARHDGRAVFVPLTAPGDVVEARIGPNRKGFAEAELLRVVTPGPGRRDAPCPHYGDCGGCDLQHLDEAAQTAARREILLDCLRRLGGLDVADHLAPPPADCPSLGHRNRIRLTAHPTGHYGLKRRGSHDVVPLQTCAVMPPLFQDTILPWLRQIPPVDQVLVRLDGRGGWLLSLYGPPQRQKSLKRILAEGQLPDGLVGVMYNNMPVWGHDYVVVSVGDHRYRVSHLSFFQSNHAAALDAVTTVRAWLGELRDAPGPLVDLYSGVGLFALGLADLGDPVLAVEANESAVRDLENNVRRDTSARGRVTVKALDVEAALADPALCETFPWASAIVIVDPPRTGLGKSVTEALAALQPSHVVYLSCDPATLARDCAAFVAGGYTVERVRPLEMFPQTAQLETLVLLSRAVATA